jgi:predicted AlkP superfamily phosphohydrolase/phosphomutase
MANRSTRWFGGMVAVGLVAAGIWQCGLLRSQSRTESTPAVAAAAPAPKTASPAAKTAALPDAPELPPIGSPAKGPRVVILGFDGASYHLAKAFMDAGLMPNCAKLAASGTFAPLGSANPAESPVAWASVNTGQNPGKTNIFGFIRRIITYSADPKNKDVEVGRIDATIGYNRNEEVAMPGGNGKMPVVSNDLRCKNFWDLLDAAGLESRVLQAACNFPAEGGPHTRLLSGLSTPDVRGGPGTFLLYTSSDFDFVRGTGNGGEVMKFRAVCPKCKSKGFTFASGCKKCQDDNRIGYFETRIPGPDNFVQSQKWSEQRAELDKRLAAASDKDKPALTKERQKLLNDIAAWKKDSRTTTVPLIGWIDRKARTIKFELGGRQFTVKEGEWSDYVPITFNIEGAFPAKATAHLHVSKCREDGPDPDEIRFYLPAITAAADDPAPNYPVAAPRSFGKELVGEVGYFDTIGWACQTHALKDTEISDASFMSAIWDTVQWRRKMLLAELAKPDWSTLFQVFGETDRVSHMMYRFFDEKHPQYSAAESAKTCKFGDREIAMKDAIPAIYQEVDKTIGLVADMIAKGSLGECTLMVCSDHGFSPFREEVDLNSWLVDQGFMTEVPPEPGQELQREYLSQYVDWSKTKAYSLGIGTIYLNLKGREPAGIVDPADADRVSDEIIAKMLAYRNPNAKASEDPKAYVSANDPQVFKGAWKRSEFLAGPYAGDIRDAKGRCVEGAADLQVGFNFGYRVGWSTPLGSRNPNGIVMKNTNRWSGDHTSVHPYLVRGIFFSTRKMAVDGAPQLQDLAPTTLVMLGQKVPDDMDGHVIPLTGCEEAAKTHAGGKANRESLVPPK